jgi:hypothetical protein
MAKDLCTDLELEDISLSYQRYCSLSSDDVLEDQSIQRTRKSKGPITFEGTRQLIHNVEINLKIYTIHGSKGLGFDTVVLFGFHYNPWNSVKCYYDQAKYELYERFFFVAVTRAKSYLAFTAWNHSCKDGVPYKLWTAIKTLGPLIEVKHKMEQDVFGRIFRTGPIGGPSRYDDNYEPCKRRAIAKPQICL